MSRPTLGTDVREAVREAASRWLTQRASETHDRTPTVFERTPPPESRVDGHRAHHSANDRGSVRHMRGFSGGSYLGLDSGQPGGSGGSIPWYLDRDAAFDYEQAKGYDPRWSMHQTGSSHTNPWHAVPPELAADQLTDHERRLGDPHFDELEDWDLAPVHWARRPMATEWQDVAGLDIVMSDEALHFMAEVDAMREAAREQDRLEVALTKASSPHHYIAIQDQLAANRARPLAVRLEAARNVYVPEPSPERKAEVARIQREGWNARMDRWRVEREAGILRESLQTEVVDSHRAVARGPGRKAAKNAQKGLRKALADSLGRYTPPPPRSAGTPLRFRRPPRPLYTTHPTSEYEHAMAALWPDDRLAR